MPSTSLDELSNLTVRPTELPCCSPRHLELAAYTPALNLRQSWTVQSDMGWRAISSHRPTPSSENFCLRAYTTLTLTTQDWNFCLKKLCLKITDYYVCQLWVVCDCLYFWYNSVSCVAVTTFTSISNPSCVYSSVFSSYVTLSSAVIPALHIGWNCHQSHCCMFVASYCWYTEID